MKRIAITGHRPNKLGNDYELKSPLVNKIKAEIEIIISREKPDYLISGMALGIDTLFAQISITKGIPLVAALPCINQDKMWVQESKEIYNRILNHPKTHTHLVTATEYDRFCMQARNRWMVDNCELLIAVWDGSTGGTGNCVKYAKKQKKPIIYINPKELI